MKKFLLVVLFLTTISFSVFSQKSYTFGITGGYDYNMNHLDGLINYSNTLPDFNLGVDWSFLLLNEDLRIRANLSYSNLSFNQKYTYTGENQESVAKTNYAFNNLDITPRVDYRILEKGKFDIYASLGLKIEFLLGKYEGTYLVNGDYNETNYFKYSNPTTSIGAVGGFVFKYNVSDYFGITLSPDYTYFFNEFIANRNNYYMQRVSVNLGVEWKF